MTKKYQDCTLIVDADTILYKAAKGLQEDYIEVRHKDHETWVKEFKNVTTFYGRKKTRDGGWIGQENTDRDDDSQISASDFIITEKARVVNPDNFGFSDIKKKVESIMDATGCKDYILLIGGDVNYRYDVAQIQAYKGARKEKPLKLKDMKEWAIQYYGDKIQVADGEEADDLTAQYGHEDYLHHKKTGEHKYVVAYIDKDLDMILCPSTNYDKLELGIVERTAFECAEKFCRQMLRGDSTDNIQGLPDMTDELREKYGLTKRKGVGPKTIDLLMARANTIPSMFEVVAECYKSYYGNETFEFTSFRDETFDRNWSSMLSENCNLLWMRREKGVSYDIVESLRRFDIECPDIVGTC